MEGIYNYCPIYDKVKNNNIECGDIIITLYGFGFIKNIYEPRLTDNGEYISSYIEYYNLASYSDQENYNELYSDVYIQSIGEERNNEYVILDKKFGLSLIKTLTKEEFYKITDIVLNKNNYYCDNELNDIDFIYMVLFHMHTYLNSIISNDIDNMINLSFGIKKCLKRVKNSSNRIVLLGNGQVWEAKRKKYKGLIGKRIRIINSREKNKKYKSVHWKLIKRLKEYE